MNPVESIASVAARHPPRVWLFWALGVAVVLVITFAAADPALLPFALDPEVLGLIVGSSLALLRTAAAGRVRAPAAAWRRGPLCRRLGP